MSAHVLGETRINDPEVVRISGSDVHPRLVPTGHSEDSVPGTVFELDDAALAAADAYEVDAYQRFEVRLRSGRLAWVYALAAEAADGRGGVSWTGFDEVRRK